MGALQGPLYIDGTPRYEFSSYDTYMNEKFGIPGCIGCESNNFDFLIIYWLTIIIHVEVIFFQVAVSLRVKKSMNGQNICYSKLYSEMLKIGCFYFT